MKEFFAEMGEGLDKSIGLIIEEGPEVERETSEVAKIAIEAQAAPQVAEWDGLARRPARNAGLSREATITANPNPIQVWDGSNRGETSISYTLGDRRYVDVRIGAPDGVLFVGAGTSGTKRTGRWVTDGMVFYLQDVSEGKPLTREHTLATVTVRVTSKSATCEQPAAKQTELNQATRSFGWRLLRRYGQIKYRYLLPIYRLFGLLPLPEDRGLKVGIETKVPDSLVVGEGNGLYVSGWCYHPSRKIKRLQIVANGVSHQIRHFRIGRGDILAKHFPNLDPIGNSYRSGFWTIVPLPRIDNLTNADLFLRATLANGDSYSEKIGRIALKPSYEQHAKIEPSTRVEDKPLIAICMATYNPRLDLFKKQIESIRQQTWPHWICIISDDCSDPLVIDEIQSVIANDQRFYFFPGESRLGFYSNFERCMSFVPEAADFVALSDHDDNWHPDKLDILLSQFDDDSTLVYSDMNLVDDEGLQESSTFWTTRPNNYENLGSLILCNSITGAASLFRRQLLNFVVPLPKRMVEGYHDHWIACVALALGKIKYVNRPLYDYVQHSGNVVGHYAPTKKSFLADVKEFFKYLRHFRERIRTDLLRWQDDYLVQLLRLKLLSRALLLRCDPYLTRRKRKDIRRIALMDESVLSSVWLAIRGLKNVGRITETLGKENRLCGALFWRRMQAVKSRLKIGTFINETKRPAVPKEQPLNAPETNTAEQFQVLSFSSIELIKEKIAPLKLHIATAAPRRVNLLIPTVELQYFFCGYISKFNLARKLAEVGFNVRIVIVDYCEYVPELLKRQVQSFQGLESLFDSVEMTYAFDRTVPLVVSKEDVFIATTWWTAHIAHQAAMDLGKARFLYLIQEYEPFTFSMGTFSAVARQTYEFPHFALFSTDFLRDYFRENKLGVFAGGDTAGERDSNWFQNAITDVGEIRAENLSARSHKKLLLYARPEEHAARNMFEMAIIALGEAIDAAVFRGEWEFNGIGTVGPETMVNLANGISMRLLPRKGQKEYARLLRDHDLGLSLMYTPHPSLVPIEMASAGMLVVTNTFANKTADKMAAISPNIIAVKPTIEDLKLGLKSAAQDIEDFDRRARGSNVQWPTSWETSFSDEITDRIKEFVEAARRSCS